MNVQVVYRLASVSPIIDNQAKTIIRQSLQLGDVSGDDEEVSQQRLIPRLYGANPCDRALGNHQHMDRCLGMDVAKGQRAIVFVDNVGRDLAGNDPLEECQGRL